jgi:xylulokinase
MAGQLLLGVDIGTYSAKGVLCASGGDVLATHTVEHELTVPRPGWAEHDPENVWWGGFVAICRALLSEGFGGEDIGAVAVSGIGACLLPVDTEGNPLRPGILYGIDTRATAEIALLNERYGDEALFDLGGMALTSQAIGPKILWLRRNEPEVWAMTDKLHSAAGFIVHRLTGEHVMDRHTASYYNPLVDLRRLEWDVRFMEPITEPDKLPRLLWSSEIAGQVTERAAETTGLRPGTPVTAGTIDAAAEAISVGVINPGDMMCMYGTTMFFINVTDRPVPDPRMWATGYLLPGLFDIAGGLSTTGALTRWFRDNLAPIEMATEASGGANAYAGLAALAESIPPGSDGLVCLPFFSGERTPINDPLARGMFAGLDLTHTRAHLYRSVLEGTAYGVRHNLEVMAAMGAAPKRLVAVGGGAKNRLWLQIVSDVGNVPQVIPDRTIGAAYGDAFLAGLGSGIISNLDALERDWVSIAEVLEPRPEITAAYQPYIELSRTLYEQTKEQMHTLAHLGQQSRISKGTG